MEQGQEGQIPQIPVVGGGVGFRSADIQRTKSAKSKKSYFVKVVDSPKRRRARAVIVREQRKIYLKEWLEFYQKPIIIVAVSVAVVMAILVAVILIFRANPIEASFMKNISLQTEDANV